MIVVIAKSPKTQMKNQSDFQQNVLIPFGKYLLKEYKEAPMKITKRVVGY